MDYALFGAPKDATMSRNQGNQMSETSDHGHADWVEADAAFGGGSWRW